MTYNELNEKLGKRDKCMLANNTWAERRGDEVIAVRLHATDILTFHGIPERVKVDTGGWKTHTTKGRINKHLPGPWRIFQKKGEWYWGLGWDDSIPHAFTDGDYLIHKRGGHWVLRAQSATKQGKAKVAGNAKLLKQIKEYAKLCGSKIPLNKPDGGDCWCCYLTTSEGECLGDATHDTSHLTEHVRDGYVVPSLVYRAMREAGCGPGWFHDVFNKGIVYMSDYSKTVVMKAVKKYMCNRFDLVR